MKASAPHVDPHQCGVSPRTDPTAKDGTLKPKISSRKLGIRQRAERRECAVSLTFLCHGAYPTRPARQMENPTGRASCERQFSGEGAAPTSAHHGIGLELSERASIPGEGGSKGNTKDHD